MMLIGRRLSVAAAAAAVLRLLHLIGNLFSLSYSLPIRPFSLLILFVNWLRHRRRRRRPQAVAAARCLHFPVPPISFPFSSSSSLHCTAEIFVLMILMIELICFVSARGACGCYHSSSSISSPLATCFSQGFPSLQFPFSFPFTRSLSATYLLLMLPMLVSYIG